MCTDQKSSNIRGFDQASTPNKRPNKSQVVQSVNLSAVPSVNQTNNDFEEETMQN